MSMYSSQFIQVSCPSQHVLLVELARQPVNAFNEAFWTDFGDVFDRISEDGDVRAIVLSSALPKLFTAGLDLSDATALSKKAEDAGRHALALRLNISRFQKAISAVERCGHPVIVAVHGLALGLGIDITSACDIRYAASDAIFSVKEVDIGLAADIGTLARLPKSVGNQSLVRELAYTARNFTAEEALALGFVSKIVAGSQKDVVAAALETAKLIASKSPIAVAGTKQLLLHARDHSVADNLEYTTIWNAATLQSADPGDALKAFKAKKPAKFAPLPRLNGKL